MMEKLTLNQITHREYLKSPLWKEIRQKAINHYGPICSVCKEFGSDVHHKTYDRVGGHELMSDLEVLCRKCHEAKHDLHRAIKEKIDEKPKNKKKIRAEKAFRYLTKEQKVMLCKEFCLT